MKQILIVLMVIAFATGTSFAKNENKQKKQKPLPPGLEKKYEKTGQLPPGWQKKLVKGEVIDSSLYDMARHYPFKPGDYALKPIKGTELLRLEDRIIRIKNDTKVILEVFGIKTDLL